MRATITHCVNNVKRYYSGPWMESRFRPSIIQVNHMPSHQTNFADPWTPRTRQVTLRAENRTARPITTSDPFALLATQCGHPRIVALRQRKEGRFALGN